MPTEVRKAAAEEIRKAICLATYPVAVKLVHHARELLEDPETRLLTSITPCHLAALARYERENGIVGASAEGNRCLWGVSCLGLIKTPQRLSEGDLNLPYVRDEEAARRLHENMAMLGTDGKRYEGVLMAPLDLAPFEPDAVVIYLSPAQALRLIIAFNYREGRPIVTRMTGQASVCSGLARAIGGGEVTVDVPCIGDRAYGLVTEDEMVMVFPASRLDELLDGLRNTEMSASYPYKPFLRWPTIFPPSMEPGSPDFDL